MSRIRGASGKVYEEMDVTKLQSQMQDEEGDEEVQGLSKDLKIAMYRKEVEYKDKTINHLMELIRTYGFCKPEMQLGRMELDEAKSRWMDSHDSYDDKNLGMLAKFVIEEMRKKGEI